MKQLKKAFPVFLSALCLLQAGCGTNVQDSGENTVYQTAATEVRSEQSGGPTEEAVQETEATDGSDSAGGSHLGAVIGGTVTPRRKLYANVLSGLQIDYSYPVSAEEIFDADGAYAEAYAALLADLKENHANGTLFQNEQGCYVSRIWVRKFNVYSYTTDIYPMICVFSEDLTEMAAYNLRYWNIEGESGIEYMLSSESENAEAVEIMRENPEVQFIWLVNATDRLLLSEENALYCLGGAECEVEGDYFHGLDTDTLAVTYAEITAEESLIWVAFGE